MDRKSQENILHYFLPDPAIEADLCSCLMFHRKFSPNPLGQSDSQSDHPWIVLMINWG